MPTEQNSIVDWASADAGEIAHPHTEVARLAAADALRGWAILGVIAAHTALFGGINYAPGLSALMRHGEWGVQLFFLLSAFTLMHSLGQRAQAGPISWQHYFKRRFLRLAPLFYVAIVYYLAVPFPAIGQLVRWDSLAATFGFLHALHPNWMHSIVPGQWSLGDEALFYLCLPFLFRWLKTPWAAGVAFAASIFFARFAYLFFWDHAGIPHSEDWWSYLYFYFPSQLPLFLLGILLYRLFEQEKRLPQALLWLAAGAMILLAFWWKKQIVRPHQIAGTGFFFIAYALMQQPNILFVNRLTIFIGRISYSLYLCHFAVLQSLGYFLIGYWPEVPFAAHFALACALSAPVAWTTYRFIELPGMRWGARV